jgi:hypothetical protein
LLQVLLHDLLLMLENKQFNDITLKIGLGWEFSLQDGQIRSSADIADEISMPIDMDVLEQRNAPDVQVRGGPAQTTRLCRFKWSKYRTDAVGTC